MSTQTRSEWRPEGRDATTEAPIAPTAPCSFDAWAPSPCWSKTGHRAAKRAIDVVGALAGLVLFGPLLLVASAIVRATSSGPAWLRQERIGRDGRVFLMYKVRTMFDGNDPSIHRAYYQDLMNGVAAPVNGAYKLSNDPRITPVGRVLRRFSLDELPQLLNVLRGDMSLVGPRPPLPYEVDLYDEQARLRLSVTPGLTGLWQVSGRDMLTFHQMIHSDLAYIAGWSFWTDLWILARTPAAVITARGAH